MKEFSLSTRMHMLANNRVDTFIQPEMPPTNPRAKEGLSRGKQKRTSRKEFSCYQPVFDDNTHELMGHLADISVGGFKLDSQNPVPIDREFRFLIPLSPC